MRIRPVHALVLAAACSLAACDQTSTEPGATSLDAAEAEFLGLEASTVLAGILGAAFDAQQATSAAPSGLLTVAAEPIVTEFDFTRTAPCREGGQIVAEGSGTHSYDRATQTREHSAAGTKSIRDCARLRGDVVFTINGDGIFDTYRKKVAGEWSGLQTTNHSGSFSWVSSDGRAGECEYDIHRVIDPDAGTLTVSGHVCGREIERVVEWNG